MLTAAHARELGESRPSLGDETDSRWPGSHYLVDGLPVGWAGTAAVNEEAERVHDVTLTDPFGWVHRVTSQKGTTDMDVSTRHPAVKSASAAMVLHRSIAEFGTGGIVAAVAPHLPGLVNMAVDKAYTLALTAADIQSRGDGPAASAIFEILASEGWEGTADQTYLFPLAAMSEGDEEWAQRFSLAVAAFAVPLSLRVAARVLSESVCSRLAGPLLAAAKGAEDNPSRKSTLAARDAITDAADRVTLSLGSESRQSRAVWRARVGCLAAVGSSGRIGVEPPPAGLSREAWFRVMGQNGAVTFCTAAEAAKTAKLGVSVRTAILRTAVAAMRSAHVNANPGNDPIARGEYQVARIALRTLDQKEVA